MKWIVLEGPDNIGKTTLIDSVLIPYLKSLPDKHIHFKHFGAPTTSDPYQEQRNETYEYAQELRAFNKDSIVLNDRSIFGELVYSSFRGYSPDYMSQVIDLLKEANIEPLFIVFYADKNVYSRFGIPSKKESKVYESAGKAKAISISFISEIHKLKYGKVVVINCSNFKSLDERNKYVLAHVKHYLGTKDYVFDRVSGYEHIPFNNAHRIYDSEYGFLVNNNACLTYVKNLCKVGLEHKNYSNFGKAQDSPTYATGSFNMVDYVFVGEAPGQRGCGTLGTPFYGDVSGNLFMKALYDNNISPLNCFITNAVKCCPRDNDLGEFYCTKKALNLECVSDLKNEVDYILKTNKLDKVFAVGNVAYEILNKLYKNSNVKICKIYHPAYYVRQGMSNKYSTHLKSMLNISK